MLWNKMLCGNGAEFEKILAGLKNAAVMSIGTASIATGLALNDNDMLLAGALPAALLALTIQGLFELEKGCCRRS